MKKNMAQLKHDVAEKALILLYAGWSKEKIVDTMTQRGVPPGVNALEAIDLAVAMHEYQKERRQT